MIRIWLAACMLPLFLWTGSADAQRVALIIGNADYDKAATLQTVSKDVKLISQSAREAGFDDVILATDLKVKDFKTKLSDFRAKANGADIAMIYYAGHAIEGQGKNWLIPVDAKLITGFDLSYEAVNLDSVVEALQGAKTRVVVVDANRNSVFGQSWRTGSKTVARGLVATEKDNVFMLYAAAVEKTMSDGGGEYSPFALSFAKRLVQPELALQRLGELVRDDVSAVSGGFQSPYVKAGSTETPVFLFQARAARTVQAAPAAAPSNDRSRLDALAWRGAASANNESSFSAYLNEFPDGLFADMARDGLAALQQTGMSRSGPAQNTASSPPSAAPLQLSQTTTGVAGETAVEVEPSPEDLAYVPPTITEPDLPELPPTPALSQKDYPDCKESHLHLVDALDKADEINRCTTLLDGYYTNVLNAFRVRMNQHQDEISTIFSEQVAGKMKYSAENRNLFYADMMQEHDDSNPEGANLAVYRAAVQLYESDRNYLQDRFCYNTGCNGYQRPKDFGMLRGEIREEEKEVKSVKIAKKSKSKKKKKSRGGKCKKSRGRASLLGGIFGGLVGKAAGLGKVGTALAAGAGAVLVGEIACQLSKDEQEEAAEATFAVTEKEEVGATVAWKSAERMGVSGSSTITALNTKPNGRKCLSITDVAIINGEETRISKQMCRGSGDERYTVMA